MNRPPYQTFDTALRDRVAHLEAALREARGWIGVVPPKGVRRSPENAAALLARINALPGDKPTGDEG